VNLHDLQEIQPGGEKKKQGDTRERGALLGLSYIVTEIGKGKETK